VEEPTVKEHAGLPEGTGVGVEGTGEGFEGTGEGFEGSPDTLPLLSIGPRPRPGLTAPLIVALPTALCLRIVPFTMGPWAIKTDMDEIEEGIIMLNVPDKVLPLVTVAVNVFAGL